MTLTFIISTDFSIYTSITKQSLFLLQFLFKNHINHKDQCDLRSIMGKKRSDAKAGSVELTCKKIKS